MLRTFFCRAHILGTLYPWSTSHWRPTPDARSYRVQHRSVGARSRGTQACTPTSCTAPTRRTGCGRRCRQWAPACIVAALQEGSTRGAACWWAQAACPGHWWTEPRPTRPAVPPAASASSPWAEAAQTIATHIHIKLELQMILTNTHKSAHVSTLLPVRRWPALGDGADPVPQGGGPQAPWIQPWWLQPGRVQPGRVQPGRVQPGRVQPGRVQPGRVQPGKL